MTILPPMVPLLGMLMPIRMLQKDFHRYNFYVPGVEFCIKVGKQVPTEWREEFIATGPQELVLVLRHLRTHEKELCGRTGERTDLRRISEFLKQREG